MMRTTILAALCAALTACEGSISQQPALKNTAQPDQCLRANLFAQCLAATPAGPQSTKYNDWDEMVSECGNQAYYLSLRNYDAIKPECRIQ